MRGPADDRLAAQFAGWVAELPHAEAVQRCRSLGEDAHFALTLRAEREVSTFLGSDKPCGPEAEELARRLDVLADAEPEIDPLYAWPTKPDLHQTASDVRHPEEWRARLAAEAERNRITPAHAEALGLVGSCASAEGTVEERLQRIAEVLKRLDQLGEAAYQRGDYSENMVISRYQADVWRMRDDLVQEGGTR